MTSSRIAGLVAIAVIGLGAPALAQNKSTVSSAALDAAVTTVRPTSSRAALQSFLATEDARNTAARFGVDAADLSAGVATLDDRTVDRLAERHGIGDRALAGGDRIVISTTAVIIALLVLILVTD